MTLAKSYRTEKNAFHEEKKAKETYITHPLEFFFLLMKCKSGREQYLILKKKFLGFSFHYKNKRSRDILFSTYY